MAGGYRGRARSVNPSQPVAIPGRSFRHPDPPRPRQLDREAASGGSERSGGGHGGRICPVP